MLWPDEEGNPVVAGKNKVSCGKSTAGLSIALLFGTKENGEYAGTSIVPEKLVYVWSNACSAPGQPTVRP